MLSKKTKSLKIPVTEGTGSKAVWNASTCYLKFLFYFFVPFTWHSICGLLTVTMAVYCQKHTRHKCTLWVRNDNFLVSKQLVYIVTRVLRRRAVRCASLTAGYASLRTPATRDCKQRLTWCVSVQHLQISILCYRGYAERGKSMYENTTNEFQKWERFACVVMEEKLFFMVWANKKGNGGV